MKDTEWNVEPKTEQDNNKKKEATKEIIKAVLLTALVILLVAGCISFLIWYSYNYRQRPDFRTEQMLVDTRATSENEQVTDNNPLANRSVSFAGLDDATIQEGGKILLENLPANGDFLMEYHVINRDTNEEVFSTDLIPSGKHVVWTPSDTLPKGVYHLSFVQTPYYVDVTGDQIPLTSGNNEVTITIQ